MTLKWDGATLCVSVSTLTKYYICLRKSYNRIINEKCVLQIVCRPNSRVLDDCVEC